MVLSSAKPLQYFEKEIIKVFSVVLLCDRSFWKSSRYFQVSPLCVCAGTSPHLVHHWLGLGARLLTLATFITQATESLSKITCYVIFCI